MTLQEYEAQGGCEGCYFYGTIDVDGRKGCTFHTRYFHDFIQHRSEIRFVKGRLKFGNSKQAAPFPSMVVIFRGAGM